MSQGKRAIVFVLMFVYLVSIFGIVVAEDNGSDESGSNITPHGADPPADVTPGNCKNYLERS